MTEILPVATSHGGPIFIVGAPRSGTTMLQYRLRNHPKIFLPTGESHFFIPLFRQQENFGDLRELRNVRAVLETMHHLSREFLEDDLQGIKFEVDKLAQAFHEEGRNTLAAIIAGVFEKNAQAEGKARWGDKTPYYVLHLPKLLEWFPDAQIIHLIRDGRDVALSLMGRRHDFGVYNTYFAAKYWQQYVEQGRELGRQLAPGQYYELFYEKLLAEPEAEMKALLSFLGEDYMESLFEVQPFGQTPRVTLVDKPIKADNAGKWRSKMTPWQMRVFESATSGTLHDFGYELATSGKRLPLLLRAAYRMQNQIMDKSWLLRRKFK